VAFYLEILFRVRVLQPYVILKIMNSDRKDSESFIPVEVSNRIPEWVSEDLPPFFRSLEEAEEYIQGLEDELEILEPLIQEGKQREELGLDSSLLPSRLAAQRKYRQQVALVTVAIRRIYPNWRQESSASEIQAQIYSLKRQVRELKISNNELKQKIDKIAQLNIHITLLEGNIKSLEAKLQKEYELREKEQRLYLRSIYALLTNDENAKAEALEILNFIKHKPDDWGFEK
jgi:hypothetical protein